MGHCPHSISQVKALDCQSWMRSQLALFQQFACGETEAQGVCVGGGLLKVTQHARKRVVALKAGRRGFELALLLTTCVMLHSKCSCPIRQQRR